MVEKPFHIELVERVREGHVPSEPELRQLIKACCSPGSRRELPFLEFKVDLDLADKHRWPGLLKDIVAISNSGGGVVLFGLDSNSKRVGLSTSLLAHLDPANIAQKLQKFARSGVARTAYVEIKYYQKMYGFLLVHRPDGITVFERDGDFEEPPGTPRKAFYKGVVYIRRVAGNTEASQADLDRMVNRLLNRRLQSVVARIEPVLQMPTDSDLIVRAKSAPSEGVLVDESGLGQRVTIVEDDVPGALPLREMLDPSVPYTSQQAELMSQTRQWLQGDPCHRVKRSTLARWYLNRNALTVTPEAAWFCFLSAADNHGFPMYWASRMNQGTLRELLEREIREQRYPIREVLPYVVGAFFWEERAELLGANLKQFGRRKHNRIQRILTMERDGFITGIQFVGRHFPWNTQSYAMPEFLDDRLEVESVFDEILACEEREESLASTIRSAAHQIDIWLHSATP